MIADLKPYADYKDSGLPWLGQVPAHWRTVRNGSLFGQRSQTGYAELPILEVSLKTGVQVRSFGNAGRKQIMSDVGKYKRAVKGDLAYNTMRMWQGALGVCPVDGLVSPAYVVARPYPGVEPQYFSALFRTGNYMGEIDSASRGIVKDRNRLYWDQFKQMQSPSPPLEEQAAIVRFLDWANNRLERAIRAKRKVIALLLEQRQAIVRRAVTKGIDPAALLEPSDIHWLGDIPKHWNVRKMKSLVRTFGGMTPNKSVERYWVGRTPWISPKDMKVPEIFDSKDHISDAALKETGISVIADEAVLIVVRGMILARTFPTAITRVPVAINQDMKALVPRSELSVDYFALLLMGIQRELLELVEIAGHGTCCLRTDSWSAFCLPIPPLKEQGAIRRFLADELAVSAAAISRLEREINLLREYRTCLVTDVVTGKLDIREAAARLPDEVGPGLETEITEESDDPEFIDEETEA